MFCPNCGTKVLDGAEFCQKCGTKLIVNEPIVQPTKTSTKNPTQHPGNIPTDAPKKKKSKKLPIILAGVFILFIVLLAVIGSDSDSSTAVKNQPQSSVDTKGVNLSKSYTNEAEGISFKYPSAWVPLTEEELASFSENFEAEVPLVVLANITEGTPELDSYIGISKFAATQEDIDYIFASDEQFISIFGSDVSVKDTSTTQLDGIPAKKITYTASDGTGYQSYFYSINSALYRIDFTWVGNNFDNTKRFFDAIIDSYSITANSSQTALEANIPPEATDKLLFRDVPVEQLLGASYKDMTYALGDPDSTMFDGEENVYGDATISFDMWSGDVPYLCIISSESLEDFTYNGYSLSDNYDELSQILGREPDDAEVFYDTYSMTYNWDHLGSPASLTVNTLSTEESSAKTTVQVCWWDMSESSNNSSGMETPTYNLPEGFAWIEEPHVATTSGFSTINGVIQNISGSEKSVASISFNLYDANGYQIGSAKDTIRNLRDGSSWKFSAVSLTENSFVSFDFADLTSW